MQKTQPLEEKEEEPESTPEFSDDELDLEETDYNMTYFDDGDEYEDFGEDDALE